MTLAFRRRDRPRMRPRGTQRTSAGVVRTRETLPFERDVPKLEELGLPHGLPVG